ncbi:MAG: hypothetical protein IPG28_20355 [Betaproteobacteria bacterium]|nr:hypothetical protein [Betaproteobacteria bacterium]
MRDILNEALAVWIRCLPRCMRRPAVIRSRRRSCCALMLQSALRRARGMVIEQLGYNLLFRWFCRSVDAG